MKDTLNPRKIDIDLMNAAITGNIQGIDCALLGGANPHAVIYGETALMIALGNKHEQAVQILLKVSDIDQPAYNGWTAMDHAVMIGNKGFVRRFMTPDNAIRKDRDGETLLMKAVQANHPDIVDLLLPLSDIDAKNKYGKMAEDLVRPDLCNQDALSMIKAFRESVEIDGFLPQVMSRVMKPIRPLRM